MAVGVYPGSFDPLTIAHLAIADEVIARFELERLDLVVSRVALAKEGGAHTSLDERLAAIERRSEGRPLRAVVTDHQLIADIAVGYDVCVVGADKWHQLHDPAFYGGSAARRAAALARLPQLAVAPRRGVPPPPAAGVVLLDIDPVFHEVSSTGARNGRDEWRG